MLNPAKILAKTFWRGSMPEDFSYPYTRGIMGAHYGINARGTFLFFLGFIPILRNFLYKPSVSERIVEDPFILSNLNLKKGSKILDFGCYGSIVPLQLANLGYKVYGVDYYSYPNKHPNFSFFKMDFLDNRFKDNFFDLIYAISSLEHVGVGYYKAEKKNASQETVIGEFHRILRRGGNLIVTVPMGRKRIFKDLKVYEKKDVLDVFKNFKLIKEEYFLRESNTSWKFVPYNKALNKKVPYYKGYTHLAVGCFVFKKK